MGDARPRDSDGIRVDEAHVWDASSRRPARTTPAASTPAELFARAFRAEERRELAALLEEGIGLHGAADVRWRARAEHGWTPGEIGAVLALVPGHTLRELAARHEDLQEWGPISPPRDPRHEAVRLVDGKRWNGERWAPTTEGELWPMPRSWEWMRLRRASRGQITKVCTPIEGGAWTNEREPPPVWYTPEIITVADDVEAWAELLSEWEHDPAALLVRGILARNPTSHGTIRRTLRGDDAWIAPHPIGRRAIVLDFDKLEPAAVGFADWPGAKRWPTPDEGQRLVAMTVKARLPACFHGAAAAYRWSASAGVPKVRGRTGWERPSCHVVFVLDRPVYDESLALWLEDKADPSVAGAEHALYLSPPRFEGAAAPTWPEGFHRVGMLGGTPEVVAPADLVDGEEWELLRELAALEAHMEAQRAALEVKRQREASAATEAKREERAPRDGRPMTPIERARAWLAKREPAIEGRGGDRHTFTTAAAMVHDFDLSDADALELMREWDARCRPPWGDAGLCAKIAAARAYGTGAKGSKFRRGYDAS